LLVLNGVCNAVRVLPFNPFSGEKGTAGRQRDDDAEAGRGLDA
jgi:hypothetical protein